MKKPQIRLIVIIIISNLCFSYLIGQSANYIYSPPTGTGYDLALLKFLRPIPPDPLNPHAIHSPPVSTDNYKLNIGNLSYPLNKFSPMYRSIKYCSISELLENLFNRIKLTDNDIPLYKYFVTLNVYKYSSSNNIAVFYKSLFDEEIIMPIEENTVLPSYIADTVLNNIDSLSIVRFQIKKEYNKDNIGSLLLTPFGKDFVLNLNSELVYYYADKNKWAKEVPVELCRVLIPETHSGKEVYVFQVLDLNGHQYLKADTLEKGTKSFLAYYKHKPEVKIIHLPGFKTKDRFVNLDTTLISPNAMPYTELDKRSLEDLINVYDYNTENDVDIKLKIGDIISKEKDYYIDQSWFLNNINKGLKLVIPEGEFKPYHMDLIIYDSINKQRFISIDNLTGKRIQNIIKETPTPAKYYFQNILFVDNKGRKTRLSNTFAFTVIK